MKVLVINAGSSSIKYRLFDMTDYSALAHGILERIGSTDSQMKHQWRNSQGEYEEKVYKNPVPDYRAGLKWILNITTETCSLNNANALFGIGHRVVHGGEAFEQPALIDEKVIKAIRDMTRLAPLHNPENLMAIEMALEECPHVPQVAVFDTAFHQSMPAHAYLYALPYGFYKTNHVRRYGFHGTSHYYVAKQAALYLKKPFNALHLITLHLGNGASASAIKDGKSIDTSMGMTPLEGLIMGTRCGDIDPAIPFYLGRVTGKSNDELELLLNEESGLKGICGLNDMRKIQSLADSGDQQAKLAIDMFCYRIKKHIGAYFAVLERVDAIIFTGGIGENSALIRSKSCDGLSGFGIVVDRGKNELEGSGSREIQARGAPVKILVVPTNEELEIAHQTVEKIKGTGR
jgi:acetate kinase